MTGSKKRSKPDRQEMLAAAEALFAERGFGVCSLRDVIGAMGCSTTAFYARFESKDEVFEELVARLVTELGAAASEALATVRDEEEGFEAGAKVLVDALAPRKPFVAVALSEGSCIEGAREVLKESFDMLASLLATQLRRAGEPPEEALPRAWAIVGAVHMQVFRWAVLEDVPDEALADAVHAAAAPLIRHVRDDFGRAYESASRRLQMAFQLHDAGVEMYRARMRREHPDASDDAIAELVGKWLRTRPGAEHGDAAGRPITDHPLLEDAAEQTESKSS